MTKGSKQQGETSEPDGYSYTVYYRGDRAQERSARAYRHRRDEIFRIRRLDLSIFRFVEANAETHTAVGWYVALIGEKPPRSLERMLRRGLAGGEPVELPDETLDKLRERRRKASEQASRWEASYPRPGETGFGEPRL